MDVGGEDDAMFSKRAAAPVDYSILDIPEFQRVIFHPRTDWVPAPPGASDHSVHVGNGIYVAARHYPAGPSDPTVLLFHGNGEVASDYDEVAPLYNGLGISLFVADYRGYGRSSGTPGFATLVADAHHMLRHLRRLLAMPEVAPSLFVMGRSLGSHPAIELASDHPDEINGLMLESGFAHVPRLLKHHGAAATSARLPEFEKAISARIAGITMPVLVIHGDCDTVVPPRYAVDFYEGVGSPDKTLVTIEGAGHNDILYLGRRKYLQAIRDFVHRLR